MLKFRFSGSRTYSIHVRFLGSQPLDASECVLEVMLGHHKVLVTNMYSMTDGKELALEWIMLTIMIAT